MVVVSLLCPRTTSTKYTPSTVNYSSPSPSPSLSSSPTQTSPPCSASFDSPFYSPSIFTHLSVPKSSTRVSWIRSLVGPLPLSPPTWPATTHSRAPPSRAMARIEVCRYVVSPLRQLIWRLTELLQEYVTGDSPSSTHFQPFGRNTSSVLASPPLPGRFPGILPPSFLTIPMLRQSMVSLPSSFTPQAKSKIPAR